MPQRLTAIDLPARKIDLTLRLFVDPGDQDYIAARWAYSSGLFHIFYWCAAQASEKYMKAFLLLQDRPIKKYRHKLVCLFKAVCALDSRGVIPKNLVIPQTSAMGRERWHDVPMLEYIEYLNAFGSSDNRYASHGTMVAGPDMHAFDIFCFAMRRLIRATNLTGGDLFAYQSAEVSTYERIDDDQEWMIDPRLLLERLFARRYQVGQDTKLRKEFSNMNFAFFTEREEDESSFGGAYYHGSPLYNHLVRLAEIDNSVKNREVVEQLRQWAGENILIGDKIQVELGFKPPNKHRKSAI